MKKIFTLLFAFVALSVSAQQYYNGQWYSMLSNQEYTISISGLWGDETQEQEFNVFPPTESTMTYQWKNRKYFVGNNYGSLDLDFYESTNGSTYGSGTTVVECGVRTDKTSFQNDSYAVQNPTNLHKFKFSMHTTYGCTVANLRLPMKHHILFENGTVNGKATWEDNAFGELAIDEVSEPYMVNFRSFYTTGDLTITSSNPEIFRVGSGDNTAAWVYAVGANACATKSGNGEAGGSQLGNVANYNFGVYFCPKAAQEYEGTITISDGTNTCTFNVTGTGVKVDQTINWETAEAYAWEDEIALASATSGLEVTYEISDPAALKFENGAFVKLHAGEVTVTAKQAGNYKFNAAENVARTFTIVGPATSAEENKTIVYGAEETWNGYDLSTYMVGSHEITFDTLNVYGGAHTITLHLTVNKIATLNVPVELAFCPGSSEFYRGTEYTEAGTYDVPATGAVRDTVYNVHVTVLQPTASTDTKTITYGAEEYWNGIALADSTVGIHSVVYTTVNAAGCDSTITLTLTVTKQNVVNVPVEFTFCEGDSAEFRGETYKTAGVFPVFVEGEVSDTVYNVAVTVNVPSFENEELTIVYGDEEEWNGYDLSEFAVGTYELPYTTTNVAGCDSTITLALTVTKQNVVNVPVEFTFCEGDSAEFRGETYKTAGVFPVFVEGEVSDTVYNVAVTVNVPSFENEELTIVYGDEEEWNGYDLSEFAVGTYELPYNTQNVAGCDSVITLALTVEKMETLETEPVLLGFCPGDSVEYRGKWYFESGLDTIYVEDAVRDTIIYVEAVVLPTSYEVLNDTVLSGHEIILPEGEWIIDEETVSGTYPTVQSAETTNLVFYQYNETGDGCEAVIELIVVVESNFEAIDTVLVDEQAEKFFHNGVLYIRRGEGIYTIDGKRVE